MGRKNDDAPGTAAGEPAAKSLADLDVKATPSGSILRVRVSPGARREAILGCHGTALRLAVSAPPDQGKANEAVRALLAAVLDRPLWRVEVVSGPSSRDKRIAVDGLPPEEVRARLAAHLGEG